MTVIEAKIIRSFAYVVYVFGCNLSNEYANSLVNYLEKVYNSKVRQEILEILLEGDISLQSINRFLRSYQYMEIMGDDTSEYELINDVYVLMKESITELNSFKIINNSYNISILNSKDIIKRSLNKNLTVINYIHALANQIGLYGECNVEIAKQFFLKNCLWNDEDSILCLAYDYYINNDFENSLYWYLIGKELSFEYQNYQYFISNSEKFLSKEIIETIVKKVKENIKIHRILLDDRCEKNYNLDVYNPTIAKILYEGHFSLLEKERIMFSKKNLDFGAIGMLVNNNENIGRIKYQKSLFSIREKEQYQLINVLERMMEGKNNNPLIITSKNKMLLDMYRNFITIYIENYLILDLDASRFDIRNLDRTYAINNFLYQNVVENQTNNIAIMYHNLHELNSIGVNLIMNLLSPNFNYVIQDIEVSIDKSKFLNIIFSIDISEIDKRIVQKANVFMIDEPIQEEKNNIVKSEFIFELNHKGLTYKTQYDQIVDILCKKNNYDDIYDAIGKIVSRLSLCNHEEQLDVKNLLCEINSKIIGF